MLLCLFPTRALLNTSFLTMSAPETDSTVVSDAQSEVVEPGSYTLATVLPLLMSPTLAKFAAGVEAVIKSQVSFIHQPHQLPFFSSSSANFEPLYSGRARN